MLSGDAVELFVPARPTTKGNHRKLVYARGRGGRRIPRFIGSETARAAEAELVLLLRQHAPATPFTGAVRLDATFVLPIPKSFVKAARLEALAGRLEPIGPGTLDRGNALKLLEDALTKARFWLDDVQVCAGDVGKRYTREGEQPGYWFRLTPLGAA